MLITKMNFKFLEHTADLKILAEGKSLEEAFVSSALGLKESIAQKIRVKEKIKKKINVSGKDYEALLYNFLEEFLYLLDAKNFLLANIKKLKIINVNKKFQLKADVRGDFARNYKFSNNVKAITYNDMLLKKEKDKYVVQFVLDV